MKKSFLAVLLFTCFAGAAFAQGDTPADEADDQAIKQQIGDAMGKKAVAAPAASSCARLDVSRQGTALAAVQAFNAACTTDAQVEKGFKGGWSFPLDGGSADAAVAKSKAEGIARYFVAELADVGPYDSQRESFTKRQSALEQAWFAIEALPIDQATKDQLLGKVLDDADALVRGRLAGYFGNFGAGLMINFKKDPPIESATVSTVTSGIGGATGVVRVEYADEIKVGLGLEAHRFVYGWRFGEGSNKAKYTGDYNSSIAIGPYIGIIPGSKDIVDVLSGGILIGILGDPHFGKAEAKISMNIGIGYFADFNSLRLANGFQDGQPLPTGENQVRLTEETDTGLQLNISFGATFGGNRAGIL